MRVCETKYPLGHCRYQRKDGFYIEESLKAQLDILAKNIKDDWDFTILISGGGEVRIGKSMLGMQIAAYWSELMGVPFDLERNFCFTGVELIRKGHYLGENHPYSPLIYDEAGADLEGRKVMTGTTRAVLDYFRECGQYNLLNIVILPEFFDLPKGIAMTRSICLLDTYCLPDESGKFMRGFFNFYSRPNKKKLYLWGKKELDYKAANYDFHGRFYKFYPVPEDQYKQLKKEALKKREKKLPDRLVRVISQRNACFYILNKDLGWTQKDIGERIEKETGIYTPRSTVEEAIASISLGNDDGT